ncbi:MAG: hypothetical protein H6Q21_2726 [Bacteroidetes bacterium]|nr:hypothetical protein [Bacteroidota bacterium]
MSRMRKLMAIQVCSSLKQSGKAIVFSGVYYPELFRIYPRNGLLFPVVADLLAFRTGQAQLPHFPVPAYFRLRKAFFPEKNIESEEDKGNNYDSQYD